jgi:hypothetical protein
VKPSITCTDPSLHEHSCSCACTNGLKFEQRLLPSVNPDDSSSNDSLDACQAANNDCSVREQELLQRAEELSAELDKCKGTHFVYQGCYVEQIAPNHVVTGRTTTSGSLTFEQCSTVCKEYKYFGLHNRQWCFCGNTIKLGAVKGKEEECSSPCTGNEAQNCGAS